MEKDGPYKRCIDLVLEFLLGPLTPASHACGALKDLLVVFAEEDIQQGISWFSVLVVRIRVRLGLIASPTASDLDTEMAWTSWASSGALATTVNVAGRRMEGEVAKWE